MNNTPNDTTAPRVRARLDAGALLKRDTEARTRSELEKELEKAAAALRQTTIALRGEMQATRAVLRRRSHTAARQVDASAMTDALTALENAANQIDAWLDAAGPLRQQLADAIAAQTTLLAADAQAAMTDDRAIDVRLLAGLRAFANGARR